MAADRVDALVIFGATGDLAKLETYPALVGLVERGVLDVPVIGVAKSGWGLEQLRDYAVASLRLNGMDPDTPAAKRMLGLLRYVDGDLDDDTTYQAMSREIGSGERVLFYLEVPPVLFGRIAQGISAVGRAADCVASVHHHCGPAVVVCLHGPVLGRLGSVDGTGAGVPLLPLHWLRFRAARPWEEFPA